MNPVSRYLRLGLRLGRHVDGMVDAYFGPPELAAAADAESPVDPPALVGDAEALLDELEDGWLRDQVAALRAYAGVLAGESTPYADEVERCYGVRPTHTDEAVFAAAHERLDELLPGDEPLPERYVRWQDSIRVPADRVERLATAVIEEARRWTRAVVELPNGEDVEVEAVRDEPWLAYCEYLGDLHSQISINVDLPTSAIELLHLTIDETYPGHHAERSGKEHLLVRGRGLVEETLVLVPTPQSLVSEGIAELAPSLLLEGDGGTALEELVRDAGIDFGLTRALAVERALEPCRWAEVNAALMLHDGDASADETQVPRALGSAPARARSPPDPLLDRADLADLRRHVSGWTRALPRVRGWSTRALPPPAHGAGARRRPPRRRRAGQAAPPGR